MLQWKRYKTTLFDVWPHEVYCLFQLWFLQHIKKWNWTLKHLPLCNVAITFTTQTFRYSRHKVVKHFRCHIVPFFLQTSLKVCNSMRTLLSNFAFQNSPHILYCGQVWTAHSTPTLSFHSHAFVMCLVEIFKDVHGKDVVKVADAAPKSRCTFRH